MSSTPALDPSRRQVLVSVGNRFVVFGPNMGLPTRVLFEPKNSEILPRVADERAAAEARICETMQIAGMTRVSPASPKDGDPDIEFIDSSGNRVVIELKVKERDPKQRDIDLELEWLQRARSEDRAHEVWYLNIERLKLTVMRFSGAELHFDELVPLNVWERTAEGVFERKDVVAEVDDWLERIDRLYTDVESWLAGQDGLRFERTRKVTMSEELMQEFAVPDRELDVLDVIRGDQVVASFVPRGLWLIGMWGRIDVITQVSTYALFGVKKNEQFEWRVSLGGAKRQAMLFDKPVLLELLVRQ